MYTICVCVYIYIYIYMEIIRIGSYDMKAEKFHSLPSVSRRIKKACGALEFSKNPNPRNQECQCRRVVVVFSHSVVSDSLQPHGLQHTRLTCPSPSSGACSNSCPLSQ